MLIKKDKFGFVGITKVEYRTVGDVISKAKIVKCGTYEYPVLSMTMHEGIVFQGDRFKKQIASVDQSTYNVVRRNQLVVSFPIDEGVLAIQDIADAGIVSPAYKIWDVDQSLIVPKFLEIFLRSPHSIQYYCSKLRGTTARRRSITDADLLGMELPLLSVSEQEKVVDIINRVNRIKRSYETALKKMDELIKARFVELFGNKGENPNGYEEDTLGNLYKFQYGKGNNIPEDKGEYPCYGSNGQVGHHTDYNSEDAPIIGHIGAYAGIVNWGAGKHYVTYNGVICNLKTDRINPVYGFHLLQQQDFNRVATKGGGQPFVSYSDLESPIVVIPPIEVQKDYAEFAKQVDKSKIAIQESLDATQMLFESLMQRYFG